MSDIPKKDLIDAQQTLTTTPQETYQLVLNWLNEKKATITDQQPPNLIKAKQGKRNLWKTDRETEQKNLTFLINEHEEGTIIRVILDTPWYNKNAYELREHQRDFYKWLSPLWTQLGTQPPETLQDDLFGAEGLYHEQINSTKTMYASIITLLAGLALAIWGIYNRSDSTISTGLLTAGLMGTVYSHTNVQRAKNKIKKLEPEQQAKLEPLQQQPNPAKSYKMITILAVILVIAFGAWAYTQPSTLTYTGNGYSFQHPRYYKATLYHEEGISEDRFEYVQCSYEDKAIVLYCMTEPITDDPDIVREDLITTYTESFAATNIHKTQTSHNGVPVYEVIMDLETEGKSMKIKFGALHIPEQNRNYVIMYLTDGTNTDLYQTVLDSFTTF